MSGGQRGDFDTAGATRRSLEWLQRVEGSTQHLKCQVNSFDLVVVVVVVVVARGAAQAAVWQPRVLSAEERAMLDAPYVDTAMAAER